MRQYIDVAQDISGNALPGATCTVELYPSGSAATIYADNGLTPYGSNVVTADVTGQFSFYAPDGYYTLVLAFNGTPYKTQTPVTLFDGTPQITYQDTGSANAYTVVSSALEKALRVGLRASFKAANSNTGASTFSYNGLTAKPIVYPGGAALPAGIILVNGIFGIEYDGTSWQFRANQFSTLIVNRTANEVAVGVTPSNFGYPEGNIARYGAKVDGATNDLAAINQAVAVCNQGAVTLTSPPGTTVINGAINTLSSYGGIDMPWNVTNILVTGTGYTAMTITGAPQKLNVSLLGTGNAANGLLLTNPQGVPNSNIVVYSLAGFGVKISDSYDCFFGQIHVQSCGVPVSGGQQWAFSMVPIINQCQMCDFGHLQVELSNGSAINIDQSAIQCTFGMIHSERVTGDGTNPTHIIGGTSMNYNNLMLTGSSNCIVEFLLLNSDVGAARLSGSNVLLSGANNLAYEYTEIRGLECSNLTWVSGNVQAYKIVNGAIAATVSVVAASAGEAFIERSVIANISMTNNASTLELDGCNVTGTITLVSGNTVFKAYRSTLANFPPYNVVQLRDCTVTAAFSTGFGQNIDALECTFNGTPTIGNSSMRWKSDRCNFAAGITLGSGNPMWSFGPNDFVSAGSVSAGFSSAPPANSFFRGERTYNIQPAVGSPKSWVCTVTASTMTSEGNL